MPPGIDEVLDFVDVLRGCRRGWRSAAGPIHEQAYEAIWQAIRTGEVAAGERLRDTDWAARLGISRTPVREALRKLEHDGVLAGLDAGGYLLRPLERQEVVDLYECRVVLEGLCARRAAGAMVPAAARERYVKSLRLDLDDHRSVLRMVAAGDGARAEQRAR